MAFTFFFRDSHTLEQAIKYLLPEISGLKKVRVWDAGCAMGPEPYTFAILLAEKMGYFAFKNVEIIASDIDETNTFGKIITEGIYSESDLSRIPPEILKNYFTKLDDDKKYIISDQILNRVKFVKNDLLSLEPVGSAFNLVICKNVLLHLQPDERVKVIRMFYESLDNNGLLVTEQTQSMPEECNHLFLRIATDANVYRKI
jgi:chemotaxis protein methyltransferase CheR